LAVLLVVAKRGLPLLLGGQLRVLARGDRLRVGGAGVARERERFAHAAVVEVDQVGQVAERLMRFERRDQRQRRVRLVGARSSTGTASIAGGSKPRASSASTQSSSGAPARTPSSSRWPTPHSPSASSSIGSPSWTSSIDSRTLIPSRPRRKARTGCSTNRTR